MRVRLRAQAASPEFLGCTTPPRWDEVFGFSGPLELEIGCGVGVFALAYCDRFPERRYIALEKRKKYAREAHARAHAARRSNLRVVEADARFEVPRLFAMGSLDVIRVHFPDPWWKRAHAGRMVVQESEAKVWLTLLKCGGTLDFRTDVEERAHTLLATLERAGFHNPLGAGIFADRELDEVPTARERRVLKDGLRVFRAHLTKPLL